MMGMKLVVSHYLVRLNKNNRWGMLFALSTTWHPPYHFLYFDWDYSRLNMGFICGPGSFADLYFTLTDLHLNISHLNEAAYVLKIKMTHTFVCLSQT